MTRYNDLKLVENLSKRGITNSQVDLMEDPDTLDLFVRKSIIIRIKVLVKRQYNPVF